MRPLFLRTLLVALAALVWFAPPAPGGSAPGPRLVITGVLVATAWPWRRNSTRRPMYFAGLAAVSLAAFSTSLGIAVTTARTEWMNSATLWLMAAGISGVSAWQLRERQQSATQTAILARLEAIARDLDRIRPI